MDQQSWVTDRFEENRLRLRGVAYRMLGSLSEVIGDRARLRALDIAVL